MASDKELLEKLTSAGSAEELRSLLKKERPALLDKLSSGDLNSVTGGMDQDREESLNVQMRIWKLGGLPSDIVFDYISKSNRFSAEDVEYIKAHYDNLVVNID